MVSDRLGNCSLYSAYHSPMWDDLSDYDCQCYYLVASIFIQFDFPKTEKVNITRINEVVIIISNWNS